MNDIKRHNIGIYATYKCHTDYLTGSYRVPLPLIIDQLLALNERASSKPRLSYGRTQFQLLVNPYIFTKIQGFTVSKLPVYYRLSASLLPPPYKITTTMSFLCHYYVVYMSLLCHYDLTITN